MATYMKRRNKEDFSYIQSVIVNDAVNLFIFL